MIDGQLNIIIMVEKWGGSEGVLAVHDNSLSINCYDYYSKFWKENQ